MAHGCAIHLYDTSVYDAQIRVVSPYGQKRRLFLLLKGDLVGDSGRNPIASGMVSERWQVHPEKAGHHFTRYPTIPPFLQTSPGLWESPKTRVDSDHF